MKEKNKKNTQKKRKGIATCKVNTRICVTKDLIPPDAKKPPKPDCVNSNTVDPNAISNMIPNNNNNN